MPQEFSDGVLKMVVGRDESSEAVSVSASAHFFVNSDPDSIVVNLDSLRSAKIGSPSPGVTEDKSWGDIKRDAGSTTDDSP